MIGLIGFTVMGLWLALSGWLAWWFAKRARSLWKRVLVLVLAFPVLAMAPLCDEVIGLYQFKSYCENARDVSIHEKVPVGQELYTPEGQWRLQNAYSLQHEERSRLLNIVEATIRWDLGPPVPNQVGAVVPINEYKTRLFSRRTGRLLAEYRLYSNAGGWVKRNSGVGSGVGGILLPPTCAPQLVERNQLVATLLPFHESRKGEQ